MLLKWWPFINPINYKWWLRIVSLLKHEKGDVINTRETICARISRLCPGSVNSWAFPWTVELSHLPAAAFPSSRRPSSSLFSLLQRLVWVGQPCVHPLVHVLPMPSTKRALTKMTPCFTLKHQISILMVFSFLGFLWPPCLKFPWPHIFSLALGFIFHFSLYTSWWFIFYLFCL